MTQAKYVLIISVANLLLFIGIVLLGPVIFPKFLKTNTIEPTITPTTVEVLTSASPTVIPTSLTPSPQVAGCIVTINAQLYDVTSLKKTHSGGDIFKCGTDMSSIFFNQHDQSLLDRQMVKYKI